jgi:hypothetical protein
MVLALPRSRCSLERAELTAAAELRRGRVGDETTARARTNFAIDLAEQFFGENQMRALARHEHLLV